MSSTVQVPALTGNASSVSHVSVDIKHTFRGDLVVDLIGPSGRSYRLKNESTDDSQDNVQTIYTIDLSSQPCTGSWRLTVRDVHSGDTGYIDTWSINFR